MKRKSKKRSVIPVYSIAVVWIVGTFVMGLNDFRGCEKMALASIVLFLLLRKVFPTRVLEETTAEQTSQSTQSTEPVKEQYSDNPEIAELQKERDKAISEIRRLNDNIRDATISRQIYHIEETTRRIFDCVISKPEKKSQIRTFLNYYLPTTIKLLNEYDRLDNLGATGANIDASKRKIEGLLEKVCESFDKQLDSLFSDVVMDVTAEVKVMEQMMQQGMN